LFRRSLRFASRNPHIETAHSAQATPLRRHSEGNESHLADVDEPDNRGRQFQ